MSKLGQTFHSQPLFVFGYPLAPSRKERGSHTDEGVELSEAAIKKYNRVMTKVIQKQRKRNSD